MNVQSVVISLTHHVEGLAEKKQAIFESTLSLIRAHGFHGAPMSLVAKNAGVAAGTIYHYFESKEKLICELYDYNRDRIAAVIAVSLKGSGSYREKFFHAWTSLYRFYISQPNVLIFFEQFVNSPYNVDKYPSHFRGAFYSFFSDGIKQGHFKPVKPEIMLVLVMGSIHTTAKLHLFGKISLTKTDLQKIVEMSWDGVSLS